MPEHPWNFGVQKDVVYTRPNSWHYLKVAFVRKYWCICHILNHVSKGKKEKKASAALKISKIQVQENDKCICSFCKKKKEFSRHLIPAKFFWKLLQDFFIWTVYVVSLKKNTFIYGMLRFF